ncbi:uncharacterized protein LOC122013839 [Zingiber officinale]|uniref:uncharacterized protein LOC122013839 n=1 Tax=Zingiber officinale TaxID=94328 RepID=UPI001C4AEDF8|nr:uncharacterized protein LOC122013839 [Zingiber officinale]
MATGQRKLLLITIDCFSKLVEAEPLARITEQLAVSGQRLKEWCEGYGIQQAFTSVAYPQGNGQDEVTNWENLSVLRTRLNHVEGSWVDELPTMLWALHTTLKEVAGVTPFHLVYDGEAAIPVEVGIDSDQVQLYDKGNAERRLMELDLVDKMWGKAVVCLTAYRQ